MSKVICIAGESGSGKTTSMRNLDPKTTFYIDADCKGLSWKGWRSQYNTDNKNYKATDDANVVRTFIKRLAEGCPNIKVIVVDTINGLMVADEMRRSKEKGYDKWVDLAACVWDLVCECYTYRDDLQSSSPLTLKRIMTRMVTCSHGLRRLVRNWTRLCWKVNLQQSFSANVLMGSISLKREQTIAQRNLL